MHKTREQRRQARLDQKLARVARFSAALASHVVKGMPKASGQEIQRRYAICQACQHFTGRSCQVCHCSVNTELYLLNKLSWADQHCPDNPSRW